MDINIGIRVIEACVFGAVFSALYYFIGGWPAWAWRAWLALAVVLAGLAFIILFGLIKAP